MNRRDAIKHTALLMGYAVSASAIAGVMQGCQATESHVWKPVLFTEPQGNLVAEIAETILPATDILGAKDAYVHEFIDLMVAKYLKAEEKEVFMAGLAEVEEMAQSAHHKSFVACTPEEQTALLQQMATASKDNPKSFFASMKQLTLLGYFTSERVSKEVLLYDPVPGSFDPCLDISSLERNATWYVGR